MAIRLVPHMRWRGQGILAGLAPDPVDPDSPDGRFRVLNVPARGRIVVYERGSMLPVAQTFSAIDGTWMIDNLSSDTYYTVVGWDGTGQQNAAIQDWVRAHVPE